MAKLSKMRLALLVLSIIFPVGFLLGVISDNIAFPAMFFMIGLSQLYDAKYRKNVENKWLRMISYIFGVGFIIFSLFIVLPSYL